MGSPRGAQNRRAMAEPVAPGALKPLSTPDFADILASLDERNQCPPVREDGRGLPDLTLEPHLAAARTWCGCLACQKIRAKFPLSTLLGLKVTERWRLYHTAWWEGVTPEFVALAATNKAGIPPELVEQKPMGVPAPFL